MGEPGRGEILDLELVEVVVEAARVQQRGARQQGGQRGAVLRSIGTPNRTIQEIILALRGENYAPLSNVIFPVDGTTAPPAVAPPEDPAARRG